MYRQAQDISGSSMDQLLQKVAAGNRVVKWITTNFK